MMAISPVPASPWTRLFSDVKIDIPGVTAAVFQQVVFRVWKDFCDKTNIWTEDVPIDVEPNVTPFLAKLLGPWLGQFWLMSAIG